MISTIVAASTFAGLAAAAPVVNTFASAAKSMTTFGPFTATHFYSTEFKGSCGYTNRTNQYIVSIATNKTSESACGKTVNITSLWNDDFVLAQVVDEREDAPSSYLNLSRVAFEAVHPITYENFTATYTFSDEKVPSYVPVYYPSDDEPAQPEQKHEESEPTTSEKEEEKPAYTSTSSSSEKAEWTPTTSSKEAEYTPEHTTSSSSSSKKAEYTPEHTTSSSSSSKKAEYTPEHTTSSSSSSKKAEYTPEHTTSSSSSSSKKAEYTPERTPEYTPKTTSQKPEWTPEAKQEEPKQTPQSKPQSSGGSSGTVTYFYQGGNPGACGKVNSDSAYIAAVSPSQYGGGSACGRNIRISANGKTVTVTVADLCPSCSYGHIDLSTGAFSALGSFGAGVLNTQWSWA